MTIKWEVVGETGFFQSIDALIGLIDDATKRAVGQSALLVAANAQTSFGPAHAKGTPKTVMDRPQTITGSLMRSIGVKSMNRVGAHGFQARVGPDMIYSRRIELGFKGTVSSATVNAFTRHTQWGDVDVQSFDRGSYDVNQSAYPYMRPGVRKSLPEMERIFISAWTRAIR
jgi:hypothetical protein